MRPALSVIFLTTLIGAGQGLFIALYLSELFAAQSSPAVYLIGGSVIVLLLCVAGLAASFLHLGHPERAWRAATMWRTSWLSREVIILPTFIGLVFVYAAAHWIQFGHTLLIGALAVVAAMVLFICTGMIYAAVKVLKEWAHPLTIINFILLGSASGVTLACAYANFTAPDLVMPLGRAAMLLTSLALLMRITSLLRNARLHPASTLQTAIGVRHPQIVQKAQGAMGGSFNTREYFHGKSAAFVRIIVPVFLLCSFFIPIALVMFLPLLAFIIQYGGLLAERWYFFAEAKHPQNLYYQGKS